MRGKLMSEQELIAKIKKLRSMKMCTLEWFELYFDLSRTLMKKGVSYSYIDYTLFVTPI